MRATINGIIVEGTPQEIMEYQRMQNEQAMRKPIQQETIDTGWMRLQPKVTSGGTTRCAHPCNCSGACEGRTQSDSSIFNLK
jgi:hypothetical protein